MDDPRQDEQDKEFGASAARDQETVDSLDEQGVQEDDLPDGPHREPRAAGKAEPTSD